MKKIILINKKEGETPLEALGALRRKHPAYKDTKMTYAGRLDPMARGLLLVLAGDEVKNKEKYLKLNKEYEFEVLFGFATDTYDILGKVTQKLFRQGPKENKQGLEKKIKQYLKYFTGKFKQKYPLYSSRTWEQTRNGVTVEPMEREVEVSSLKFIKLRKINNKKLLENVSKRIAKVKGDFRQKEIIKIWRKNLQNKYTMYEIASFKIKCSSGTYVRAIANELGGRMGTPALAFSIKRTKIGKWGKIYK